MRFSMFLVYQPIFHGADSYVRKHYDAIEAISHWDSVQQREGLDHRILAPFNLHWRICCTDCRSQLHWPFIFLDSNVVHQCGLIYMSYPIELACGKTGRASAFLPPGVQPSQDHKETRTETDDATSARPCFRQYLSLE